MDEYFATLNKILEGHEKRCARCRTPIMTGDCAIWSMHCPERQQLMLSRDICWSCAHALQSVYGPDCDSDEAARQESDSLCGRCAHPIGSDATFFYLGLWSPSPFAIANKWLCYPCATLLRDAFGPDYTHPIKHSEWVNGKHIDKEIGRRWNGDKGWGAQEAL